MFGFNITDEMKAGRKVLRYWGARAIFKNGNIDLLPDRQTFQPQVQDEKLDQRDFSNLSLVYWISTTALPWLRQEATKLSGDSDKVIQLSEKRFLIAASTQSSYGYLYIGAAEFAIPEGGYDLATLPTDKEWSGNFTPQLGQRVKINFNQLGEGTICSFFWEHGYAGIRVRLDAQPEWHKKQNQPPYALVFGAEVMAI